MYNVTLQISNFIWISLLSKEIPIWFNVNFEAVLFIRKIKENKKTCDCPWRCSPIMVCTVCHSICMFWIVLLYGQTTVKNLRNNIYSGVRIFWIIIIIIVIIIIAGIATGSQYCSRRTRDTFIGQCEKDTSKTIAVNTHQFGESIKRKSRFDKVILILRNPYDVIIDEFGRRTVKTTATGEKTRFKTKGKFNKAGLHF